MSKSGDVVPARYNLLGSGYCFDAPQNIPSVFVVRVENRIHSRPIDYNQSTGYMGVMQSKFTKIFPNKGGGAPGAPIMDPPLLPFCVINCDILSNGTKSNSLKQGFHYFSTLIDY